MTAELLKVLVLPAHWGLGAFRIYSGPSASCHRTSQTAGRPLLGAVPEFDIRLDLHPVPVNIGMHPRQKPGSHRCAGAGQESLGGRKASHVAEIPFEIEQVLTISGRGPVVLARALTSQDFSLGSSATLNDRPLRPVLEVPRLIEPDGSRRLDLFAFTLEDPVDLAYFTPGQQVVLRTSP